MLSSPRTLAAAIAIVLASATGTGYQAADPLAFPPDFPQTDSRIWGLQYQGLTAKLAADALTKAPDTAETFELLLKAQRPVEALGVLQRIADKRPDQVSRAARAAAGLASELVRSEFREHADRLRDVLAQLKTRVAQLPREDEAVAARHLLSIESQLSRRGSPGWAELIQRYVREYAGTDAVRLAEVEAIAARPLTLKRLEDLEAFAREHPGTCAAAKAHYQRGFDLAHNNSSLHVEPQRGDPLKRLLMVDDIVKELESGRYAGCEPVQKAAELITGFHTYQPTYAPGSVERMLAVYENYVKSHFVLDARGETSWGIGYLIASKMADLYALQGDRITRVERLLEDIARDSANAPAARYLLAEFYLRVAQSGDERLQRMAKARETLAALHSQSDGLYARKALARLAVLEFAERRYAEAVTHLMAYLARYPESPWAWVAALRLGHAHAGLGDWNAAASAFHSAATKFSSPLGRVLAHAYTARAYEALGRFGDALAEHERALELWDDDYGPVYSLFFTRAAKPEEPFRVARDEVEVVKSSLAARVAELHRTASTSAGALLERGRWLFGRGQHDEVIAVLTRAVREQPDSPIAAETRELLHRSRLIRAVEQGDAAELQRLSREPFDFWVAAAGIARAAISWKEGDAELAQTTMRAALDGWLQRQQQRRSDTPPSALERDVLAIRNLVFRPRGDGLFAGTRWELKSLEPAPTPFFVARQAIDVKVSGGVIAKVRVDRPIPDFPNVLFWDAEQIAFFDLLLARIGGTEKGQPTSVMQVPNQPVGGSVMVLELLKKFFPARPGHWGGWMFETFPMITQIEFTDASRTKAAVRFTVGYEGATAILEKQDGVWTFKEMTNRWIT